MNADNISLYSDKRIAIRHHADITAKDLSLISNGEGLDSRVHIRHNSQIKVDNLTLEADARATLGNTSVYTIANSVNISSNIEFSAIWKNTSVNAQSVNILSNNKNLLSKNTSINSPVINLSAPECNISKLTVTGNSGGNCFDTSRPTAKLSRSAKEINAGESVSFSAKKSSDNLGIIKYSFFVNSELVRENQNPEFSHRFIEGGTYYVQIIVEDADGYRASATKKIVVAETLARSEGSYFDYRIEENNLSLVFHQMIPYEEISSAKFIITELDGEQGVFEFPISNFYHRSEKVIEDFGDGDYKIGLSVTDIYNREFLYERVVNYTGEDSFYKNSPIVEFEVTPVSPKEIMVDFRKIFDPSNRLQWIDIDWGDGSVEEANHVTSAFMKHKYSNVGEYEIKLIVAKEIDGEESLSETIRTISITSDEVATLPPLVDYNILNEEFAPYVTFNINRSISPNAEIVSVVFDHGDGSFYSGADQVHTHFYDPGVYVTKLTVTDSNGLSVTQSSQIVVTDPLENLVANLSCEKSSYSLDVECEIVGVDKLSALSEITVDWGDGIVQEIPLLQGEFTWDSFEHSYTEVGTYKVTLSVSNNRGESKSSEATIELAENTPENQAPYASIYCSATGNTKEIECDFSGSNDPDGYIENFNIKISDGNEFDLSNSSPLFHNLESNGIFEILLTVTDNNGASSSTQTTIEIINQLPIVDAFCESHSVQEITCTSYSYDPDGYIVNTEFDWGEGSISGAENSFTAQVSSGGARDVRISVIDNEGGESFEYRTIFVVENQAPIAVAECYSLLPLHIECNGSNSSDDDLILEYEWETEGGVKFFGQAMSYTFPSGGDKSILLKITDSFRSSSEKIVSVKVLETNESVVSMVCEEIAPQRISCGGIYLDPSGAISKVEWAYNGEVINTANQYSFDFTHYFEDGAGDKNILITIYDKFGVTSTTSRIVTVSSNTSPSMDLSCSSHRGYVASCKSRAFDLHGVDKVEWFYGGSSIGTGEDLEYKFEEAGQHEILARVTDSSGISVEDSITVDVTPSALAQGNCILIGNLRYECNSFSLGGEALETTWSVDGITKVGEKVVFQFESDGPKEVVLTVRNIFDRTSFEVLKLHTEDDGSGVGLSGGSIVPLNFSTAQFNPILESVVFEVRDVEIKLNEEMKPELLEVVFNGDVLPEKEYILNGNLLTLNKKSVEGANSLSILARDHNDNSLAHVYSFVSGQRRVDIGLSVNGELPEGETIIVLKSLDQDIVQFTSKVVSGEFNLSIQNLPNHRYFLRVLNTSSQAYIDKIIVKSEEVVDYFQLDLITHQADLSTSNFDFSEALDGWEIVSGEASLVDHLEGYIPSFYKGEGHKDMQLSANGSGELRLVKSFLSSEEKVFNSLNLKVLSNDKNDLFFFTVWGSQSGFINSREFTSKEIGNNYGGMFESGWETVDFQTRKEEIIRVEVFAKFSNPIITTKIERIIDRLLPEKLYALDVCSGGTYVNSSSVIISEVSQSSLENLDFSADLISFANNKRLKNISLGRYLGDNEDISQFPSLYIKNGELVNPIELRLAHNDKIIDPVNLRLGISPLGCKSAPFFVDIERVGKRMFAFIPSGIFGMGVKVNLGLAYDDDITKSYKKISNRTFPVLEKLFLLDNKIVYGKRDYDKGRDDWVLLSRKNYVSKIDDATSYGDLSYMNGGEAPPHSEHRDGVDFDLFFGRTDQTISNTKSTLYKIIDQLNSLEYPLSGYSSRGIKRVITSDQTKAVQNISNSTCLKDGRLLSTLWWREDKKHSSHQHFDITEIETDLDKQLERVQLIPSLDIDWSECVYRDFDSLECEIDSEVDLVNLNIKAYEIVIPHDVGEEGFDNFVMDNLYKEREVNILPKVSGEPQRLEFPLTSEAGETSGSSFILRAGGDDTCKSTVYSASLQVSNHVGKSLEQLCDISGTYKFEGDYNGFSGGNPHKIGTKVSEIQLVKGEYDSERNVMSYIGSESFTIDYDDPTESSQSGENSISGTIQMNRKSFGGTGPIENFNFKDGHCSFSIYRGSVQGDDIYTKSTGGE